MPERVEHHETWSDLTPNGAEITHTNITGKVLFVCDCCGPRKVYNTGRGYDAAGAVERHEGWSAAHTSAADMGIYPTIGEQLSDYLPGFRREPAEYAE